MARTFARILVPTDFSETSDAALGCAKTLAEKFGASLCVLHVFEDPFTNAIFAAELYAAPPQDMRDRMIKDARARLAARLHDADSARIGATADLVTGSPTRTIVDYAAQHKCDLIVMGTHGRSGFARLMIGSVAERVLRTAPCPVLTVRLPEPPSDAIDDATASPAA